MSSSSSSSSSSDQHIHNNNTTTTNGSVGALLQQPQSAPIASSIDSLTCQWTACGERATSAESLYEHVCERHVGRKSTNNLNLQCQWGNCRTTTVKRDHITSHIRVHVPLKPHKCDFCQKSFKRPQDLKKHVKTHADESVLLKTPEPSAITRAIGQLQNGYQQGSKAPNYYTESGLDANGGYNYNNSYAAQHQQSTQPSYGPVYYQVPQTAQFADSGMNESRKRGHDVLNDFFGDVKRRHIDPNQYHDLSARFGGYHNNIQPMLSSYQSGYGSGGHDDFGVSTAYQTASHPHGAFSMPFPELRSKNDLMSIDSFLEKLQNTVYEHPDHAAASGVLPMGQVQHTGLHLRSSNSPPRLSYASSQGSTPGVYHHGSLSAASGIDDTPALTPSSYQSTHSPSSVHSSQLHGSPVTRATGALYPMLPSVSALTDMQSGTAGVPHSSLGNTYDEVENRRRYSGGYLQRAQPASPTSAREGEDKLTELAKQATAEAPEVDVSPPTPRAEARSPCDTPGNDSDDADERQEAWVQNMRMIEALREFVRIRLERGEFDENDEVTSEQKHEPEQDQQPEQEEPRDVEMEDADVRERESLYPVLRAVQEAS